MKIERAKNAGRNIVFGVLKKLCMVLFPFLTRTAMLRWLGTEYLGLNGLFLSVISVLNLAELGVSSAIVFCMYKPIAENDNKTLCGLMHLFRHYYRLIGIVVGGTGLALLPLIPKLVGGEVPADVDVYVLYLLNLLSTVFSYFLFAYRNCLFTAYQREDIPSKVALAVMAVQYPSQILALYVTRNYYWYVAIMLVCQLVIHLSTAFRSWRMFPQLRPKGRIPKEMRADIGVRIRALFLSKIGYVVVEQADTIVISAFLGLTVLAQYQNYYYILSSVNGIIIILFLSVLAGIGNSLVTETREKNFHDLETFTFIILWVVCFCGTSMLCLFQPFMEIWVGEELLLPLSLVVCLCVYFAVREIDFLLGIYKDASGIWHQDRFRPAVTALCNLVMNLIMVQFWGLYGVLLSTILSMVFVGMPWLCRSLFSLVFPREWMRGYVLLLFRYTLTAAAAAALTFFACSFIHFGKWPDFLIRAGICLVLPNLLLFLLYRKTEAFRETLALADRMTNARFRLEQRLAPKSKGSL